MPRGRKPAHASPTRFLNTKRRVIYRSETGKYFAKTEKGGKLYNPAAKFYMNPAGSTVSTKYVHGNVAIPSPIRPKFNRVERKNAGMARGPYKPRVRGVRVLPVKRAAYLTELEEGHKPKRPVGRPRKVLNWNLPNPLGEGLRKVRRNKGAKRGPRKLMYRIKLGGQYVA
jgi:hypothetical protein